MQQPIIGWDIGGAHVKAALIDAQGHVRQIFLQSCPLWQGIEVLQKAVTQVLASLSVQQARHVITMTGELADCFAHREEGVQQIIGTMQRLLSEQELYVFAGAQGFLPATQVNIGHTPVIASANWLATAYFVAQQQQHGVLIDVGSTTTDIVLFQNQTVQALGLTDYQRLLSGELVYTGVVRTAVMAVAQQAVFNGQLQGLMAEYFATMADVYRVTGELQEAHDQTPTADGAEKSIQASARRLSRMTGYDFRDEELHLWQHFAAYLRAQQLHLLETHTMRQLSRGLLPSGSRIVGAGIGRFLVQALAQQFGYAYHDFDALITMNMPQVSISAADCAPAVSVALLFTEQF